MIKSDPGPCKHFIALPEELLPWAIPMAGDSFMIPSPQGGRGTSTLLPLSER